MHARNDQSDAEKNCDFTNNHGKELSSEEQFTVDVQPELVDNTGWFQKMLDGFGRDDRFGDKMKFQAVLCGHFEVISGRFMSF